MKQKHMKNVNTAYLLTLVTDQIKTVAVTFDLDLDISSNLHTRCYTYLTLLDVKPGDEVIAEAQDGLSVVRIVAVHDTPQIDPNATYRYKWAVSTKGTGAVAEQKRLHEMEQKATEAIRNAKKKAERETLKEQLKEYFGESLEEVKKLDFSEGMLD